MKRIAKIIRTAAVVGALFLLLGMHPATEADRQLYNHHLVLPYIASPPSVYVVADEAALRAAFAAANDAVHLPRIELAADITLSAPLPPLDSKGEGVASLIGNGHTLDGAGHGPVIAIGPGTTATIDGLTIRGGMAECGGGIYSLGSLTVRHSHILDNRATNGGGICVGQADTPTSLTLEDTILGGNVAVYGGGGIYANIENGSRLQLHISRSLLTSNIADMGGAIYNRTVHGEIKTTISSTAITYNEARNGGGIYNHGFEDMEGYLILEGNATLNIINSTLSGNTAINGGAISANTETSPFSSPLIPQPPLPPYGGSFVHLAYSTISDNTATDEGGGLWYNGSYSFQATIIADNSGGDCVDFPSNIGQFYGYSIGHNLDSDDSCNLDYPSDVPRGVADLWPLAVNPPGKTPTHALGPASQARDRIPFSEVTGCGSSELNLDQRNVARPQPTGGSCDIGSFEARAWE